MKRKLLTLIICAFPLLSASVLASSQHNTDVEPWQQSQWNKIERQMPTGDVARGEQLHRDNLCMSCHGDKGEAPSRNTPSLVGNQVVYLYKSLIDYQQGRRNEGHGKAKVMQAATHDLSLQDMADLAVFYAAQTAQPMLSDHPHQVSPETLKLVKKGDMQRMITPCASCHGTHGEGQKAVPALAGQSEDYFVRTMLAYKDGRRKNDIAEGMAQFVYELTDEEIKALATYYANLPIEE